MPRLKSETIGGGNMTWLGSDHGIFNCRTSTLDVSTFTKATHYPSDYFVAMVRAQIDRLLRDAERDGQARVACIATHPFLSGQPHTIGAIERILDYVRGDDRLWVTRAGDIAEHYLAHHYDAQLAHATRAGEATR